MDIILIPGLWLRGDAWSDVESELTRAGHRVQAVTLPGQGDGRADATLRDQVDAVVATIDAASAPVLVVGHSAASALAWIVADARPDSVVGVVMIGGMPVEDGKPYANFFPLVDGQMPFPGWEPFAGADSADLDDEARRSIEDNAVAVPEGVCHGVVSLSDDRRFDVPVTVVCPEYSPSDAQEWIDAGQVPELTRTRHVTLVDIDSGHWPMVTRPQELAGIIARAALQQ
ncbi:alpha/beta fold hydrolase [Tessaracoccus antarcticus]|uniref:Alpha/beta hydrolase n=1 Tax=Tessaracoccus antarcticus TaxID=2479848 RepID=A0A3M0G6N1_9ACTN|nr:alpha/beta hydrolase [Tessaracoccus antarcticus]RMB60178.1 alpha/beta hydrolase [Tessaracoccus antarcticus]